MVVDLCHNRVGGFTAQSKFGTGLPSSCFFDTVVIPLAATLYLLTSWWMVKLIKAYREVREDAALGRSKTWFRTGVAVYFLMLLVTMATAIIQLWRLVAAHTGIGLLPFFYPVFFVAFFAHIFTHRKVYRVRGLSALAWAMLATAMIMSAVAQSAEEKHEPGEKLIVKTFSISSQVATRAVLATCFILLLILEFTT